MRASVGNEGALVCMITSWYWRARGSTSCTVMPSAGASISLLSGTSAAGCASQVGYQNERISRLA